MRRLYNRRWRERRAGRFPAGGALVVALLLGGGSARMAGQDLEGIGEREAVTVNGSVSARGIAHVIDGIPRRRSPLSYVLSGSVNVNLYDLELPFAFTVSEQNRSISQPFNQFGVSPRYRWMTAHLGYRNLSFSPFTLAGHQIFGAGVELNPGDFRLGFVAGRLNRAVEEDTMLVTQTPAYERTGFSGRIGYGSEANHFDLIVLKARDDSSSLRRAPTASDIRPAENLVIGASARATIIDGLSLHGDFAVSDYTRDIRSEVLSLTPEAEALGDVIPPRASTQIYTALTTGLAVNIGTFGLQASYARIDPDYRSMGAYYLNNDLESFTLAPSLSLLDNTLYLNGSISFQRDNIQMKKRATTERWSPMLTASWSPSTAFGLTIQANDLLTAQKAGTLPVNDTLRMEMRTPTLIVSPRYMIDDSTVTHSFHGSLNYQGLLDANTHTSQYTEYTSLGGDIAYTLSLPASGLTVTGSLSSNQLENNYGTYYSNGFSIGGNKMLMNDALTLDASFGMSFHGDASTINAGTGGAWRPDRHHAINLNLSLTTSRSSDTMRQSFSEYNTVLTYVYTF